MTFAPIVFIFRATIPISDDVSVPAIALHQWYPSSPTSIDLEAVSSVASHMISLVSDSFVLIPTDADDSWESSSNRVEFTYSNKSVTCLPLCSTQYLFLCCICDSSTSSFALRHTLPLFHDACMFFLAPFSLGPAPPLPEKRDLASAQFAERAQTNYAKTTLMPTIRDRLASTRSFTRIISQCLMGKGWNFIPFTSFNNNLSKDFNITNYSMFFSASLLVRNTLTFVWRLIESDGCSDCGVVGSVLMSGNSLTCSTFDTSLSWLVGISVSFLSQGESYSLIKRFPCNGRTYELHKVIRPCCISPNYLKLIEKSNPYPSSAEILAKFSNIEDKSSSNLLSKTAFIVGLLLICKETEETCSLSVLVSEKTTELSSLIQTLTSQITPAVCLFCRSRDLNFNNNNIFSSNITSDEDVQPSEKCQLAVFDCNTRVCLGKPGSDSLDLFENNLDCRIKSSPQKITISHKYLDQISVFQKEGISLSSMAIIEAEQEARAELKKLHGVFAL
ncbi:hypothetical protein RCL1_003108 [Eukaryota sp. TZLM3-RCL]